MSYCEVCRKDHDGTACNQPPLYSIERMPMIKTTKQCIAEAIAARDKWWVTVMEANFAKSLLCSFYPDTCDTCYIKHTCHTLRWQQFKLSLQSSAALTNLIGKFPDLPDTTEEN